MCTGVRFAWEEAYAPPARYVSPREKRTPAYVFLLGRDVRRRTFRLGRNVRRRYVSAEEKRTPPSRRYVSLEEKRTPQLGFSWGVRFAWGETYAPPAPYVSPRQKRTPAYVSPQEKRTPADPQIEQA